MVLTGGAVAAVIALSGWGMWVYMNHDRLELIDRPDVVQRAERGCARMTAALHAVNGPDSAGGAEEIRRENAIIDAFIASVRGLGREALDDDRPSEAWLDDWQRLRDLRAAFAQEVADGSATAPAIPTEDGEPITRRMNDVGILCEVPPEVLDDFR